MDQKNILFNVLHMSPGLDPFYSGCFQPDGLYIGIWEETFGVRFSLFLFFFFHQISILHSANGGKKAFGIKAKRKKNDLHFSFVISYNAMVACMYTTGDVFRCISHV